MKKCIVKDCDKPSRALNLCRRHYYIQYRGLDPHNPKPRPPPIRYKLLSINGKRVYEHRHVMETHLGYKLRRNQHVHHINHDIHDNRLENLEVLDAGTHVKLHTTKFHINDTHYTCSHCKRKLTVNKFGMHKGRITSWCKKCRNARQLASYYRNKKSHPK